jgi:hypothetical protein
MVLLQKADYREFLVLLLKVHSRKLLFLFVMLVIAQFVARSNG